MGRPRSVLRRSWLPALLLPALLGPRLAPGQPVRCAPCSPDRIALCPPVASDCPEAARQPGCGCCQTCALGLGQPCGVYTARCRLGLRCHVPAGEPRPLSTLIQGHGTCLPASEVGAMRTAEPADPVKPDDMPLESTEITQDQLLNYQLMFPMGQDKSIPWNAITAYENMKAKRISELKTWKEQQRTMVRPVPSSSNPALWSGVGRTPQKPRVLARRSSTELYIDWRRLSREVEGRFTNSICPTATRMDFTTANSAKLYWMESLLNAGVSIQKVAEEFLNLQKLKETQNANSISTHKNKTKFSGGLF
ncbi:insulin-like growth factor-binding protein 1 isoform X1 [Chiroxiphia lanceolata]|uniref:insulin-like growth factor-binding protein 1 isoform X1 n=1 Tax=Chiroxiphia lanceolata TaxID=296741 RepID=UPI0013CEE3B8|nr:insulin-like growth factor-binding protein 1 isoform X1 [Chiroxiphia lanceolata]